MLRAADTRLGEVRRHVPDAGGLVIASDQAQARSYARHLHQITGRRPVVVLSDDQRASSRIDDFAQGTDRWMVAVRMVSEGVDVPRLMVGVYATATQTPLFFAQAVGRFVRTRRRGEVASVFLPSVPIILAHAADIEKQRDHVIGRPKSDEDLWDQTDILLAGANAQQSVPDTDQGKFTTLESRALFDHVLFDAQAYGLSAEPLSDDEADYLGLPGLLDGQQLAQVLAERQRRQVARQERQDRRQRVSAETIMHRDLAAKRKRLNSLVSQYARTHATPHSHVHAELRRRCGGPALAGCSRAQVEARIAMVTDWLGR